VNFIRLDVTSRKIRNWNIRMILNKESTQSTVSKNLSKKPAVAQHVKAGNNKINDIIIFFINF